MAAIGMSRGAVNGDEPRNAPGKPLAELNTANAQSNVSDTTPMEAQSAAPRSAENASIPKRKSLNVLRDLGDLAFKVRDPPVARGRHYTTEVDIIGVAAIGSDPEMTWTPRALYTQDELGAQPRPSQIQLAFMRMSPVSPAYSFPPARATATHIPMDKTEPAWITRGIRNRKDFKHARVLLYDHGELDDEDTLKLLAEKLLDNIQELRRIENENRPIFFVCHSTGGLVVKMALAEAQRFKNPILGDCYGITFFGTPHRGSSYLSMPDFSSSIAEIMELSRPLPQRLAKQFQLDHPLLRSLDDDFKALATDLQVWTFFETVDSDLTNPDLVESDRFPFHAPITSIKSALLNLRHEVVYPLLSDHANCAAFGMINQQTKESYLAELAEAIERALELKKISHFDMNLDNKVQVEVNGFYEGSVLTSNNEIPIRVWSTNRSLGDFIRDGPAKLLKDRLEEVNIQPRDTQYLRHNTRAPSLLPNKGKDSSTAPAFKTNVLEHLLDVPDSSTHSSKLRKSKSKEKVLLSGLHSAKALPSHPTPTVIVPKGNNSDVGPVSSINGGALLGNALGIISVPPHVSGSDPASPAPPGGLTHLRPAAHRSRRHSDVSSQPFLRPQAQQLEGSPSFERRGSEGNVNTIVPAFSKPDISKQRLVWIHVPFNNPLWVKNVLERISIDQGRDCHSKLLSVEHWESKHVRGRHSEHHACFLKPGCSFIGPDITSPPMSPRKNEQPNKIPVQMCLYLPFLHFDTYKVLVKRRTLLKRRIKQGRSRPVPQSVAKLPSLEFQVIWQFLGHDPPINCRRTLDQFGYPGLLDTRARDDDQMLYKMTKQRPSHTDDIFKDKDKGENEDKNKNCRSEEIEEEKDAESEDSDSESESEPDDDVLDGNVLMVDQLWLWIVDSATTATFFPKKEPLITDGRLFQQADLRNSIFNEVNADLTSRCENSFDLAALVALHAVTILFDRSSHPDLEIFRIFEEAISILTEKMTTSFKRFRARGFRDKAIDYDNAVRTTNIRAKHKREGALAEKQNRENTSALLELRDIEDELHTLQSLFDNQMKAIQLMISNYEKEELKALTGNGLGFLRQAEQKLGEYMHHVEKMIESVRNTRGDFDKLLQMVQRQAQVDEVRLARLQADLASAQSRSVMIFTVFTVIFLPLTFFTGLFGMNTKEWGGGSFMGLSTIGIISIPASFAIITIALIIAWSIRTRRVFNALAKQTLRLLTKVQTSIGAFLAYIPATAISGKEARKRSIQQKRERKRLKKEAKKEAGWLDDDFWEAHVVAREKDYRLPPQNRKSVSLAKRRMMSEGRRSTFGKVDEDTLARRTRRV